MPVRYKFSCCNNPAIEEIDKEDGIIPTSFCFSGDKLYEERPWGNFKVLLDSPYTKVKRITVNPNQKLSLQYHNHRSEIWSVVNGYGKAQVNDDESDVEVGSVVEIPKGSSHRMTSSEVGITFIEVQLSDSQNFSEDDIVRLEDEYGR